MAKILINESSQVMSLSEASQRGKVGEINPDFGRC